MYKVTKSFNHLENPVHPVKKNFKRDEQDGVLQRFLHSAPHFVRRSSRNDSKLPCHPERSASGVEGSRFEIPRLVPTLS